MCEIKKEEKEMIKKAKTPNLEHPQLYHQTQCYTTYVQDAHGNDKVRKVTTHSEWDKTMSQWVKLQKQDITETSPLDEGFLKSMEFGLVYPNEEPTKQGRKVKPPQTFLMQKGVIKIKDKFSHVYLVKNTVKATGFEGSTSMKAIFVRSLSGAYTFCYRSAFQSDDVVDCTMSDEVEVTLDELKKLEDLGLYLIFYGKMQWSETEGFMPQTVAYKKSF
jgi:hypothetical protein